MIDRSAFFAVLAALLLAGCAPLGAARTPDPASESVSGSASADGEGATAVPEEAAGVPVPDGLLPAGSAVLTYDEIRPVLHDGVSPFRLNTDYYTMRQGELWGLMRTDGTEVLPCAFSVPFYQCERTDQLRWHTGWPDGSPQDLSGQWNSRLAGGGDGILCVGHGGTLDLLIFDGKTEGIRHFSTMDGFTREHDDLALYESVYGPWLPCYRGTFLYNEEWDEWDWRLDTPLSVSYYNTGAEPLNGQAYENAGFFFDQPLAPVEQDGKWAYIDQRGIQMTGMVYSATCGMADRNSLGFTDESIGTAPIFASPLLNGYAAVCRDGKYGLLDSQGQEFVPCQYGGAAWDGGALWLLQEDGWHQYTIPGVAKPAVTALLPQLPATIVQPDRLAEPGERTAYTTTWQDNLKVRAGPGTSYPELSKLPPGTPVEKLGASNSAENWLLIRYTSLVGWVCSDYLN